MANDAQAGNKPGINPAGMVGGAVTGGGLLAFAFVVEEPWLKAVAVICATLLTITFAILRSLASRGEA